MMSLSARVLSNRLLHNVAVKVARAADSGPVAGWVGASLTCAGVTGVASSVAARAAAGAASGGGAALQGGRCSKGNKFQKHCCCIFLLSNKQQAV